jgi:succinate dehydrogenase / fumarate reductase cytochrome b subunit
VANVCVSGIVVRGKRTVESQAAVAVASPTTSVFARHSFLIKRIFSLSGLFFSGYVVVHLMTNASLLAGPRIFQENVNRLHSLGPMLPLVEWTFLFIPILFHALVGWAIILGASPNLTDYRYVGNVRYTLQRVTAILLFFFIVFHIWHMHHYGRALGGGDFVPEMAASSTAKALKPLPIRLIYALGVLSAAFHLGNGIWTAGVTWGFWLTPAAQRRANGIAWAVGILVMLLGVLALIGARRVDIPAAEAAERLMEQRQQWLLGEDVAPPEANKSKATD